MIPKEFDYVAPSTVAEALHALAEGGDDAKILAGGHSLIPLMKLRLAAPSRLVDLGRIDELKQIMPDRMGQLRVGAMVTYQQLVDNGALSTNPDVLTECAASVGDVQVRARGTLGGSIAHADPAADLPAAILALDAVMVASRTDTGDAGGDAGVSSRHIPATEFFQGLLTTALEPGEILTSILIPVSRPSLKVGARHGSAYIKVRNKASHYALVGAAAVVSFADDGTCDLVTVAITGAAASPFRLSALESALHGSQLDDDSIASALAGVGDLDVQWMADLHGSADYRRHLTTIVATRALQTARARAHAAA